MGGDQVGGVDFILHNDVADPFFARCKFVDREEVLYCEAMAMLMGLQAVFSEGFCHVHEDSDSEILLRVLLCKFPIPRAIRNVVHSIWAFFDLFDAYNLSYVYRKINEVVNWLARNARDMRSIDFWREACPSRLNFLICANARMSAFCTILI